MYGIFEGFPMYIALKMNVVGSHGWLWPLCVFQPVPARSCQFQPDLVNSSLQRITGHVLLAIMLFFLVLFGKEMGYCILPKHPHFNLRNIHL